MQAGPDGSSQRDTWEYAAARGSEAARAKLDGPEFPEPLTYLWLWGMELFGKSGAGAAGFNGLTYTTIKHWSWATGQYPEPREVRALMRIDSALRHPDTARDDDEPVEARVDPPWPERKTDG